jgi:N-acetyl-gamma-glutamyl-phosphate reductase
LITSERRAGDLFSDVHPFFEGVVDTELKSVKEIDNYDLDLVFLALPHGVSMEYVKLFKDKKFKIIDLSGDFRLYSAEIYEKWYNKKHIYVEGFNKAVFGSPELFKDLIKDADLIANPGCYPTSAILALAPLMKKDLISQPIIVDSKSGITGAGVKAKDVNMYSNVNENFKAYGLKKHRHTIEIQSVLNQVSQKENIIQFTPHLLPVDRGILSTVYAKPKSAVNEVMLKEMYEDFYADAEFVRLRKSLPTIKDVRGTNFCDIYVDYDERTEMILIISAIDNLVKGAAGQAVQNMNIMFGFDEGQALNKISLNP